MAPSWEVPHECWEMERLVPVLSNMPRKLRYVPEESLVEVTCRAIQRRLLLKPSPALNSAIIGILARAQRSTGARVCAFVYLSNHCHLLLRVTDAQQLAAFMRYVNSNIAREVGRLYSWREKVWGRRYTDIVVSHEPEAQLGRLRYILEQGVKEGLVASPRHWPGAHSADQLAQGTPLEGVWVDRTEQYRAHLKGEPIRDALFTTAERLELSPLPCWEELAAPERQTLVRALILDIRRKYEKERAGQPVMGKAKILAQHPHDRPRWTRRSPAPRFHAVEPRIRRALEDAYRLFRRMYRQAAEDLKAGRRRLEFPAGSFPPPAAFVPLVAPAT